jgi:hypothetical protein
LKELEEKAEEEKTGGIKKFQLSKGILDMINDQEK